MKITVEHVLTGENEIIVKCQQLDSEMQEILAYFKKSIKLITAQKDGERFLLQPNEIYYVDSVDNKLFIYTKDAVLESKDSLLYLETHYSDMGLVRIGKSQLANLHHIKTLKSIMNSRIQITLESGDRLVVSRHYVPAFKSRLGIEH
jgi:DNA-binding LytR/AlgR family response regulator